MGALIHSEMTKNTEKELAWSDKRASTKEGMNPEDLHKNGIMAASNQIFHLRES